MVRRYFTSGAARHSLYHARYFWICPFFRHFIALPVKHWSFAHSARVIHVRLDLICNETAFRGILIRSAGYGMQPNRSFVYEDAIKPLPEIYTRFPHSSSIIFVVNNDELLKVHSNIGRLNLSRYRWIEITNDIDNNKSDSRMTR